MNSSTSGWLVLTRNFVAGSHPQNDTRVKSRKYVSFSLPDRSPFLQYFLAAQLGEGGSHTPSWSSGVIGDLKHLKHL